MTPVESVRSTSPDGLPLAFDGPVAQGRLRQVPEDFRVEELAGRAPLPDGAHWLLRIEKRGLTTRDAVRCLARLTGVHPRGIGYAGMKDRLAVTQQWFSVQRTAGAAPDWSSLDGDGLRCLQVAFTQRKLRPGELTGNRFRLRVRGAGASAQAVAAQLARIVRCGMPNYFGPQRFGREGRNLARARRLLATGKRRQGPLPGMLISAARAHLFNRILARRIDVGNWDRVLVGDMLQLDGDPRRIGPVTADAPLTEQVEALALHPTGSLWGRPDSLPLPDAAAARLEQQALAPEMPLCDGLVRAGVRRDLRPLRARVGEARCERHGDDLLLCFVLPPGSYATTLVRELISEPPPASG